MIRLCSLWLWGNSPVACRVQLLGDNQSKAVEVQWLHLLCVCPVQDCVAVPLRYRYWGGCYLKKTNSFLVTLMLPSWMIAFNVHSLIFLWLLSNTSYIGYCVQVDCSDNSAVFAHCFPATLLPLFLDGLPFCDFHPLHAVGSNRWGSRQYRVTTVLTLTKTNTQKTKRI